MIVRHVGEVQVDQPRDQNEIRDPLDGLMQNIIGHAERLGQRRGAIDRRQQTLVGDGDDRVDAFAEVFEPSLSLKRTLSALELERLGHHGHGQGAELAREAGDDRRRAGPGAAPKPGGDKHHVRPAQHPNDLVRVFERRLAADRRIGSGAQPFGELGPELHLHRGGVLGQRLDVGVSHDELDALQTGAHHAVDRVGTAAADADHLDAGAAPAFLIQRESQIRMRYVTSAGVPPLRISHDRASLVNLFKRTR